MGRLNTHVSHLRKKKEKKNYIYKAEKESSSVCGRGVPTTVPTLMSMRPNLAAMSPSLPVSPRARAERGVPTLPSGRTQSQSQSGSVSTHEPSIGVLLTKMNELHQQNVAFQRESKSDMTNMCQEFKLMRDEMAQSMQHALTRATHAEDLSNKTAHEVAELKSIVSQQQHTIDVQQTQLQMWQLQSELDRPQRAEKMNTVYVVPSANNYAQAPFPASEHFDPAQARSAGKASSCNGVEVTLNSREACIGLLKKFPMVKNTDQFYKATFAKTPLQQRRERFYNKIKMHLPRSVSGITMKGQLYIANAPMSQIKKREASLALYPSWNHANVTPNGLDVLNPVRLDLVPEFARHALQSIDSEKTGHNLIHTMTHSEIDVSDVEMADRFTRGRRSPTGETPDTKRAATK